MLSLPFDSLRNNRRSAGTLRPKSATAIAIAIFAASTLWAAAAHCQRAASDSTAGPKPGPRKDWLPHGSYYTQYNVNRTVQTWTQGFTTPYSIGKLQVNTNVSYSYSTDSNNDRNTVNRLARTSFNYLPLEGLKLGMSLDVSRNSMETPAVDTRTKTERDKVLVTGEYKFSPVQAMETTVSGRTGAIDEMLENRTVKRMGQGRNTSLDLKNTYAPWDFLSWNLGLGGDFTALDSEDSKTGLQTKDRNRTESYSSALSFRPNAEWAANLSLNRIESQFQYPRQEAQETKRGLSNGGELRLSAKPLDKLNLELTARTDRTVIDFDLERVRSTVTEARSYSGALSYELLGGTKLESKLTWDDERNEYGSGPDVPVSVKSQAGYLYTRSLSGSISRSIGPKLEGRAVANISIRSYQFDDKENNVDDRDMVNYTTSLDLDYTPSQKYTAGLGFSKRVNRLVYINSAKSSNNREGETYTVTANLTYRKSSTTSISQNARISADYSFYEYSKSKDFLIRNTSLHTIFRTRLLRKIGLTFIHDYRFQDQGGVTETGGVITYGRTGDNDRQDLTIKLDYSPVNGVTLGLSQRFQEDKRYRRDETERELISDKDRVELLGMAEFKYKISQNTDVDGSFQRMESTVEGIYWRVAANFKRTF